MIDVEVASLPKHATGVSYVPLHFPVGLADQVLEDCCFCYSDNYDHCWSCGSRCNDSDHPIMKSRTTMESDCIVM